MITESYGRFANFTDEPQIYRQGGIIHIVRTHERVGGRVQKKSRLHGSEPEENSALYDVFEEGYEICINNPGSAKFLYNATSTVKQIAHLQ